MKVTRHAHVTGILLALSAAVVYGAVPNFARLAFLNGVPALESVFYRTSAVAVVLAIIAVLRSESFVLTRAALPAFMFQCLATLMVSACYLASLQFLPVTLSVVIFYTFPMIVLVMAPIIEGRVPNVLRFVVAVFGFAGLYVAVGPAFNDVEVIGLVLAALGAVGCALQFFSGRMLSRHLQPAAFGSLVHLAIWPLMLALCLGFGAGQFALLDGASLGPFAGMAVALVSLAYVGGYYFHMASVTAAPASAVAPFFNLEPIISTALAVFILGESMTLNQWFGGAMILAALIAAGFLPEDRAKVTP